MIKLIQENMCVDFQSDSTGSNFRIELGDITKINTDFIVNAANPFLRSGSGVCGAIFDYVGKDKLQAFCNQKLEELGRSYICPGDAVSTHGTESQRIIHAVGPDYRDWQSLKDNWLDESEYNPSSYSSFEDARSRARELLRKTYQSIFNVFLQETYVEEICSISIPSISTGIYSFPLDEAAKIVIEEIVSFIDKTPDVRVILVCYDMKTYMAYLNEAKNTVSANFEGF